MKKRILAIMLVLPLLVAFAAMGFTKLVSLTVPQMPEDIKLEYDANEAFEFENFGESVALKGEVIPASSGAKVVWSSSDESIATVENGMLTIRDEGVVTLTASLEDGTLKKSFTAMLVLTGDTPKYVKANYRTPTEKGETAVGLYDFSDSLAGDERVAHNETIEFRVLPSQAPQEIEVEGLDESLYKVEGSAIVVSPSAAGEYALRVKSATVPEAAAELSFRAVDAVNVYSYEDLLRATNLSAKGTPIVLRSNLESKANLGRVNSKPFAYASGEPYNFVTFESTYDTRFLKKSNLPTQLKAAVEFKADVYGNGHTINLHDCAYPSETDPGTGIAIPGLRDPFAGNPLSFVTAGGLTVYGQGNAGFLIRGNGVTLDNIVLKNCNNVDNLSNLDYVGTVAEVMGNDVTIKNSTLQNGRTVVRSFSNQNLVIEDCVLAYAREFIFKQGSNKFVYPQQSLSGERSWEEAKKDLFDYDRLPEAAKRGDSTATIRNTSFYKSGIFSIGMDAHFAGQLLYRWIGSNQNVNDLAATSYKSVLRLEGDVKFYDWKIPSQMDSSTLVSGSYSGAEFKLDIAGLLANYDAYYGNNTIIKTLKGTNYVHGGISFFGGGNNLSEVYFNGESVKCDGENKGLNNNVFVSLRVSLADENVFGTLQRLFSMAAGEGYFYFCIYRNTYNGIAVDETPFV